MTFTKGANTEPTRPAIERFAEKCKFQPETGCVLWIGGTTCGHGKNDTYGAFWFEGRRWFAHRWAAVYIHDLDVGNLTVGHCCPWTPDGNPNTLCVEHVCAQTLTENVRERNERYWAAKKAEQTPEQRRYWVLVSKGYEEPPPEHDGWVIDYPRFDPPDWIRPYL